MEITRKMQINVRVVAACDDQNNFTLKVQGDMPASDGEIVSANVDASEAIGQLLRDLLNGVAENYQEQLVNELERADAMRLRANA